MFFIINNWDSTIYNASLCFHCIPDNVIIYTKEEIPMIFPDNSKPIGALDKEITISCKRRKYKSAEFFIQSDKEFKNFEIELYLSSESKPVQKFFYDRQKLIISDLMENQCYLIRVRGVDIESNIYTKWSKETSFYPLKGTFYNYFSFIF